MNYIASGYKAIYSIATCPKYSTFDTMTTKSPQTQGYEVLQGESKVVESEPSSREIDAVTTQPTSKTWAYGLCECPDCGVCICSTVFGMCYDHGLAVRMNENWLVPCFPGGIATMRTKIRLDNEIEGSLLNDVFFSCFAPCCVLCQMGNQMNKEEYPKVCCNMC